MTELVITRGYPGSGKTTFARQWVAELDAERTRVNRDDLRSNLFGVFHGLTYKQEQAVTTAQQSAVEALLKAGQSVVVDDTNLKLRNARAWADMAVRLGVEFRVEDITTDRDECIARDLTRSFLGERFVGTDVIDSFASRYRMPWPEVEPTPRKAGESPERYVRPKNKPGAYIVDIDGTVAQMVDRGAHDYHRVGEDAPKWDVIDVVRCLHAEGFAIVFMSGRKDSCRKATEEWLERHVGPFTRHCPLFMREADDNRADFIVKAELFDEHVRHDYEVAGCFDDRDQVVALWRSIGLTCFQVAEGAF